MTPGEFRLRVAYGKRGRLRWLSHLELVHALERIIRRSELSYAVTQGFSPHLKAAFGPALPVGTAGENEYFDVWLRSYTSAEEALGRLRAAAPDDLAPTQARFVGDREPSLTAALTIATYDIEIDGEETTTDRVHAGITQVLADGELTVENKGKTKVFDLRQSVPEDAVVEGRGGGVRIALTVRMGPSGSLRPESLVRAALQRAGIEPSAVRTTRLDTFIESDEGVWSRPV